jgi:REP element-mobilizing transposase RayT
VPRPLRIEFPGALYHVTSRGNDRARIFWDDVDRRAFLIALGDVAGREQFSVIAYCLMGNHHHLVLETRAGNLSGGMQRLNSAFAQGFNRRRRRTGHLFQGRYHSSMVEEESHLLEVSRYVVLNPVRAGLCLSPESWRWSSFRATAGLDPAPAFLEAAAILEHFGPDVARARARFRTFVHEAIGARPAVTRPPAVLAAA